MKSTVQGTVAAFDADLEQGSVLLDDGLHVPFKRRAFQRSGLRSLRLGQRVRLEVVGEGDDRMITALTIVTLPLPS